MQNLFFPFGTAIFTLDREGRVTSWSEACAAYTGLAEEDVLGRDDTWRAFYQSRRPLIGQLLLKGDQESIVARHSSNIRNHSGKAFSGFIKLEKPLNGCDVAWSHTCLLEDESGVYGVCQLFEPVDLSQALDFAPIVRGLIDKFPMAVVLTFEQKILLANQAYADLIGFENPEQLVGLSPRSFISEEEWERFDATNAYRRGNATGQAYRWRYRIRDGSFKYLEGRPVVIPWGDDKALISTQTDVTEIVEREKALKRERSQLEKENALLLKRITQQSGVLRGQNARMSSMVLKSLQLAKSDTSLIILGETGTGKSMLARFIHDASHRAGEPFVVVNCAAIPEQLLESEFFGHTKGAFTGATSDSTGFLGAANRGTLFLDEVAELNPSMQAKLLHALETKQYTPVGARTPRRMDLRLICATNRNLTKMKAEGSLREDFYYRIFVVDITIPPLRERKDDIPLLARFFFDRFSNLDPDLSLTDDMLDALQGHDWPGNVRELQNVILRYIATGSMEIAAPAGEALSGTSGGTGKNFDVRRAVEKVERSYFLRALKAENGNRSRAARLLGLNLRTFYRHCTRLGLKLDPEGEE